MNAEIMLAVSVLFLVAGVFVAAKIIRILRGGR